MAYITHRTHTQILKVKKKGNRMTLTLIQKLLTAVVVLTSFYATFIFAVYYDLMRKISKSLFNLLPGLIIFGFGIAAALVFDQPDLIFKQIFPLKSGFARGILGATVFPLIGASIRTLSIIASSTLLIDKMWFYWRSKRLFFIIRMIGVVCMAIIAGNTLFKIIFTDQPTVIKGTTKLNIIGAWAGSILGTLLFLITIMALPHIFGRKKDA